jgi:hypothetical protein
MVLFVRRRARVSDLRRTSLLSQVLAPQGRLITYLGRGLSGNSPFKRAAGRFTMRFAPDAATLDRLRAKFPNLEDDWLEVTGAPFDALTEAEARTLLRRPGKDRHHRTGTLGRRLHRSHRGPAQSGMARSGKPGAALAAGGATDRARFLCSWNSGQHR